ncbi:MAG: thioredoxin family protein [Saprospiraceae bacterium]|nr:thioredoxin family protein [Saprospiraceae bacterium]MCF8250293.1 thioredoxin family protein [Saprospiraceae bacterium]MCF8280982.1 thioredoxin family protein [Bacteroidales bacterium]MCF8312075.1 thioredoxin family protein [Saprospiraceae bacterium]MCF8440482.1 thioredoxin family protein [Saprospiraceae bacterium]
MKKYLILLAFALLIGSNGFAQGIEFTPGTWKEIKAKAAKEDKLIFMDAYAEWCGPCKKMARDVFTEKEVGDYFNAHFVNVKMDMEKGEGIGLSSDFGVQAYPTLLFINSEGKAVHRAVGYHTTDLLIGLADAAKDPNRNTGSITARYDAGDRSPQLLFNLAMARYDAMDGTYVKIADEYLATQKDWNTDDNLSFIFRMADDLNSKMADYLMNNRGLFEDKYGKQAVTGKVDEMVQNTISHAETEADLKKVETLYTKTYPERASELSAQLRMGFYAQREDWTNFAKVADKYFKEFPAEDWTVLNDLAWMYYDAVDSKKELKCALGWAKQSVKMDKNYANTDTVASLYYKLGKKGKALKYANEAIALAKATDEDYSPTELLIQKIKG